MNHSKTTWNKACPPLWTKLIRTSAFGCREHSVGWSSFLRSYAAMTQGNLLLLGLEAVGVRDDTADRVARFDFTCV